MRVPNDVRIGLREKLWALADELGWSSLGWSEKSTYYESWTKDPEIGGLLGNFMDQRRIRVYIKDTVMKGYARSRLADPKRVMRVLGLEEEGGNGDDLVITDYERPHGRLLRNSRVIAWGDAKDWKAVLMALHERAYSVSEGKPFAGVLMSATGRFLEEDFREMVQDAASKLGVERLLWLE